MTADILAFPKQPGGSVFIAAATDGDFYVVLAGPAHSPAEIILGGPHTNRTTAESEAQFVAADFGVPYQGDAA